MGGNHGSRRVSSHKMCPFLWVRTGCAGRLFGKYLIFDDNSDAFHNETYGVGREVRGLSYPAAASAASSSRPQRGAAGGSGRPAEPPRPWPPPGAGGDGGCPALKFATA